MSLPKEFALLDEVRRVLTATVSPGERLLVGFSGGMDSMALLHAIKMLEPELGNPVTACHVHHGLSLNADKWAAQCEQFCMSWDIPFTTTKVNVAPQNDIGLECAARNARQVALARHSTEWILLGHHRDDLAETVLLNLFRGTGMLGLAAMEQVRGNTIRPFLSLPRSDIHEYALANKLAWIEDESNQNNTFSRNFIRNKILPLATQQFPAAVQNLAKVSRHAAEAQSLLRAQAKEDMSNDPLGHFPVGIAQLVGLENSRLANVLRSKLHANGLQAPTERRLHEFIRQLRTFRPDRHPSLQTKAWCLYVKHRQLHLSAPANGNLQQD